MIEQNLGQCIDRIESRLREVEVTNAKQAAMIEIALKNAQNLQYLAVGLFVGNMAILGTILAAVLHAF